MSCFVYNLETNKLHIEGYCIHSKIGPGKLTFQSEQEALAFDGRAVSMCKLCMRKREFEMR